MRLIVDPFTARDYKHQVAQTFGDAALTYDSFATVQQQCAQTLVSLLQTLQPPIPQGTILEVGCGTGFVTQKLISCFPQHSFDITDISSDMLMQCQQQLLKSTHEGRSLSFQQLDGEMLPINSATYAAIVSGFVVQWFETPAQSLQNWVAALQPGGALAVSFPTSDSFPEWRQICQQLGLPFTGNPLPHPTAINQSLQSLSPAIACQWYEAQIPVMYRDAMDFFKSFKRIGAGLNRSSQPRSPRQLRQIIEYWNQQSSDGICVHYHVAFLIVQRQQ